MQNDQRREFGLLTWECGGLMKMNKQAIEIMYSDLREGYEVLQGEYERLKDHCVELKKIAQNIETDKNEIWMEYREYYEKMTEIEDGYEELATNYNNAQKEISILENGGNENEKRNYEGNMQVLRKNEGDRRRKRRARNGL